MSTPVPFRNMRLGAAFRRSGHPTLLLRKVTAKYALVHGGAAAALVAVPGKEWCWPAKPLTTRRYGDDRSRSVSAYRGWDKRREHDEADLVNFDPGLRPLWNRVHTAFRGTPEQRLRAFEQYVHDHPSEALEALQGDADAKLEALLATRPRRKAS